MGCSSANDVKAFEVPSTAESKAITIIFKLSTGEEYTIQGKENEMFKNVLNKFISEHREIDIKTVNSYLNNNKIDLYKTLAENNITENNIIVLDIEKSEHEDEDNISIEYNPENVIWIDPNVDNDEIVENLKKWIVEDIMYNAIKMLMMGWKK